MSTRFVVMLVGLFSTALSAPLAGATPGEPCGRDPYAPVAYCVDGDSFSVRYPGGYQGGQYGEACGNPHFVTNGRGPVWVYALVLDCPDREAKMLVLQGCRLAGAGVYDWEGERGWWVCAAGLYARNPSCEEDGAGRVRCRFDVDAIR